MKVHPQPKLVDRAKLPRYFRDLDAELLDGINLCQGCPYDYVCCRQGTTYWAPSEVETVSLATGQAVASFATGIESAGIARGFYEGKNPCPFLRPDNACGVYELRPGMCII